MQKNSILNMLSEEEIIKTNANPYYQRNYIWSDTKAVKLIETVLINGEIPPLTMFKINNKNEIIDGKQRYETLLRFYNNCFSLKISGLSKLPELAGLTFSKLPPNLRKIFEEYRIKIITYNLKPGTQMCNEDIERIKRDLFRRYNYGMVALKTSEVARAKYLYDDLTNKFQKLLLKDQNLYDISVSLFIPISKRNWDRREIINLLLMAIRELLSMIYIPIIGVKTVKLGFTEIDKYYNDFVREKNTDDKVEEFIKIINKLYTIKKELCNFNNPISNNILFFKCVYWMLNILYIKYPQEFYDFEINRFVRYLENKNNAQNYFNNYKNLNSNNIISRHIYVKNYLSEELKLEISDFFEETLENRKRTRYVKTEKINSEEDWLGINMTNQIVTNEDRFSINEIITLSNQKRLIIRPIYQRNEVINIEKASKIIESMLLGIKLPPLYMSSKKDINGLNTYTVIDGQQRLISILKFLGEIVYDDNLDIINVLKKSHIKNFYNLEKLNDFSSLNGKNIKTLPSYLVDKIKKYQLDVILIREEANPNFDPVDMFKRMNESPCNIKNNCFEMWNSFDTIKIIEKAKEIAKYDLFKQNGKNMKEAELVTILGYLAKKNINLKNIEQFLNIHLVTENKDKNDERIEVKISLKNKREITNYLANIEPDGSEEEYFIDCLDKVNVFAEKLKILSKNNSSRLIDIINPYLKKPKKGNMKDFYIL